MNRSAKRNATLCPNCQRLVSLDDSRCPYCGLSRPGAWWKSHPVLRIFSDPARLIRSVIILNVGMYLLSVLLQSGSGGTSFNPLTALAPSNQSLLLLGATGTIPVDRFHRWWSLISANWLHANLLHIGFNMIAFYQLSPFVAREYGGYRMLIIYTLGGSIGFLASYLAGVVFTIGASAAVCSLMGAILYFGKSRGGVYGTAVYRQVGVWAITIFLFGFIVPGINNWAHGGGMAAGAILGMVLGYGERVRENLLHRLLAFACVAATAATLAWAVFSGISIRLAG
ncbi:MAG: rhomboid family intramembrane serine protease [Desulfobacteraceae bacterium]|jgi:rhomboid protease GluP|nr:rhomboid family intramembrane serine protease [Desulfobacteraceae bacterium]